MKDQYLRFVSLTLLVAAVCADSQTQPHPKLVSEFGMMPCEHVHAQTDASAEEIKEGVGSRAAIVIYLPTVHPEQAHRRRSQISSFLQNRGLSADRFTFYKGERSPDGQIRTQFWKLNPRAELSVADALPWIDKAPETSRAFVFGYADEINICPTFVPAAFANLILKNSGSRGHIVIEVGKDAMIDKLWFAGPLIKELVENQGIPRKRLRLFFTKSNRSSTGAEFWFVPARRK